MLNLPVLLDVAQPVVVDKGLSGIILPIGLITALIVIGIIKIVKRIKNRK